MNGIPPDVDSQLEAGLMVAADAFNKVLDLVEGHRSQCVNRGFSDDAAEDMAVEFHRQLFGVLGAQMLSAVEAAKPAAGNRAQRRSR